MNSEYQKRIKLAKEVANDFFKTIDKTGDMEMLEHHKQIDEMYLKALDVTGVDTEEERDFYFQYSTFYEYKAAFIVNRGELTRLAGDKKTFTTHELKEVYDALTMVIDSAIKKNDKYQSDYIRYKEEIISDFNKTLEEHGFTVKKEGCYIATAVYGSYDCPQVWVLRNYRDKAIARHFCGRIFIRAYYFISPILVKKFSGSQWFIHLWRGVLDAIVGHLLKQGY